MPRPDIAEEASQILLGVAKKLREARIAAGLSQAAAASRVGMDPGNLSRLERGKHPATRATLIALATVYNKPLSYFGLEDESLGTVPRGTPASLAVREEPPTFNETVAPRHARNLPLAVREYLAEFQVRLVKGGASEDEIDEAITLLRSPSVFTYFKGGHRSEYNEQDVLDGMRAIGEDVIIPRLQKLGRKVK